MDGRKWKVIVFIIGEKCEYIKWFENESPWSAIQKFKDNHFCGRFADFRLADRNGQN